MANNFAYSLVATAPSPATSGTNLVVTGGQGALFPAVPFNVTIWPASLQPLTTNAEIATVTAISTDTFTIVRAQEDSTARSVIIGDQIANTVTAETLPTMGVLMDKTSTDRNYNLLPSSDFMALDTEEIGGSYTMEVPATSSLEVYSPPSTVKGLINPYKFYANRTAALTTAAATVTLFPFTNEVFDTNNNFDSASTFAYTVPVSGFYFFQANMLLGASVIRSFLNLNKNGTEIARSGDTTIASLATVSNASLAWFGQAASGETFTINYWTQAGVAVSVTGTCNFSGFMVCAV